MRGMIDTAPFAHSIVDMLPAVYQEDDFTREFVGAFDAVVAPLSMVLDSLDAYVDPMATPEDFLPWLASWVGLALHEDWSVDRRRRLTRDAVGLFALRGTAEGVRREVELYTGGTVTIEESGGVRSSQTPLEDPPGVAPGVVVRVSVDGANSVHESGLRALVRAAVPAHLAVTVELIRGAA